MKQFTEFFTENQIPIVIIMCVLCVTYLLTRLGGPDIIVECPDNSTVVVDLPMDLERTQQVELISQFDILTQCGAPK